MIMQSGIALRRSAALSSLLLLLLAASGCAAARSGAPGTQPHPVDAVFARWNAADAPGCAVAVSEEGQVVLSRAYGMADLEHGVPNTASTVFEAGSVSKQLTAAAVVLLAQQGRLSLDDDVRKHVPEVPDYGTPITIRHLLNHTSGLRDWGGVVAIAGWPRTTRVHTHAHVLQTISRQRSLNHQPGAEYAYTNSGYNLLTIIVERVSGRSLSDFSREHIFEPLGMTHTQWRDDFSRVVPHRAIAYRSGEERSWKMLMPFENVYGNGGLLTTTGDLLRWTENLESGRVGGQHLIEEMHRQAHLNDGKQIGYAGGLFISSYRGTAEVYHSGSTAGYRAFLTRFPERQLAVAVLCNAAETNPTTLARRTADIFLGAEESKAPPPPAIALAPERVATLSGVYQNRQTGDPMRLEVNNEGELRMNQRTALVPLSDRVFRVGTGEDRLEFSLSEDRRVQAVLLITSDDDSIAFAPVAAALPTSANLQEYAGVYVSDEAEASYDVVSSDGVLELRRQPDMAVPLIPAYGDVFTTPTGWTVKFLRNDSSAVTGLSLSISRVRDLRFARAIR